MRTLEQVEIDTVGGAGPCDGCAYALGAGGGALAGGKAGMMIGAKFGSLGGPIGIGVGAVLGGLAGVAVAYQAVQ